MSSENQRIKFIAQNYKRAIANPRLNDWEKEFLVSLKTQIDDNRSLSQKQFNKLKELADK